MIKPQPYILRNSIQHYDWGTRGKNAFIPKLLHIKSEKNKPYAELWMGTHPKASSRMVNNGREFTLTEVIRQYPKEMLGSKTAKKFSNTLPFLFKVLSANEALSIQAHPNKRQAIILHKKDPANYPDPNQKLEIAIALDSLTALVGFMPFNQIMQTLKKYPQIHHFIGEKYLKISGESHSEFISEPHLKMLKQSAKGGQHDEKIIVKNILTALSKKSVSDEEALKQTIQKLNDRIRKKRNKTELEQHFIKLYKKYNTDVGLLILFFLNLVHLRRGEAIFTNPGVPHAYLKGNILECMSNSDNVIRAGLTPKFKDLNTLLKVLTFELGSPNILKGQKQKNHVSYKTAAKEFVIQLYNPGKSELEFNDQSGPRILLILDGKIKLVYEDKGRFVSQQFWKGDSLFLPSILSKYKITSEKSTSFALAAVP